MNYIFYLKQNIQGCLIFVLSSATSYSIMYYLGYDENTLTIESITGIIMGSIIATFGNSYCQWYYQPKK